MISDEYKTEFELVWQGDLEFSRGFMPEIMGILGAIKFQDVEIRNNENTLLDLQGSDLTILPPDPLQIGVRVRRNYALRWDEFTQDDKERRTMSCDVYFLGYADKREEQLVSYMVWDGHEFEVKRNDGTIPLASRQQNKIHSRVYFNCYSNCDIARHCRIYKIYGPIAGRGHSGFKHTGINELENDELKSNLTTDEVKAKKLVQGRLFSPFPQ